MVSKLLECRKAVLFMIDLHTAKFWLRTTDENSSTPDNIFESKAVTPILSSGSSKTFQTFYPTHWKKRQIHGKM